MQEAAMNHKSNLVVPANGEPSVVRFPNGLLKQLGAEAEKNGRSRNSEIVYRLVQSLNQEQQAA
jgi:hypothetical protein